MGAWGEDRAFGWKPMERASTEPARVAKESAAESDARKKERKIQETEIMLKKRFGKNAIIKGMNLEKGATTVERNKQVGGHRSGN